MTYTLVGAYAGIGSRETPDPVLHIMAYIARVLRDLGFILHSGGADGADTAFERGCADPSKMIIFLPWNYFNYRGEMPCQLLPEAFLLGEKYHKYWPSLKQGPRKLMARNSHQVLGMDLNSPVKFVLCWTPDGCEHHDAREFKKGGTGGTGQAISIASMADIPVINMFNHGWLERLVILTGFDFKKLRERLNDRASFHHT